MTTLVVGGGLAGAAVALRLAEAGWPVTVLERDALPRGKVCGEFLSVTALAELSRLGVDPAALGAIPLTRFSLSRGRREASLALPFAAASLSRERLDAHLLDRAEAAGATVRRGVAVRRIACDGAVRAETSAGPVDAAAVVVATGKHDVHGHGRGEGSHRGLVGLKRTAVLTAAGRAALADIVAVVLVAGGYCGIEPVEDGRANVCVAVSARRVKAEGVAAIFASLPAASARAGAILAGAERHGASLAVGRVPYGFVRRSTDGPFYVGDQAAVIPSVCGEGMGIALRTARIAAEAILAGRPAPEAQAACAAAAGPAVRRATVLSRALCHPATARAAPLVGWLCPAASRRLARAGRIDDLPAGVCA